MKHFYFNFFKYAGLISFGWVYDTETEEEINIHLFPKKKHQLWGKAEDYYDRPFYHYGLGPLILIVWG